MLKGAIASFLCLGVSGGTGAAEVAAKEWNVAGTLRSRAEFWRWFDPGARALGTDHSYAFVGNLLRVAAQRQGKGADLLLELSAPFLIGLPADAVAPPPQGQLGMGASYRAANNGQDASLFVKQANVTWKRLAGGDTNLRLGRFEFIEGIEAMTRDATLDWIKRERIAGRLIGNFGFSHVQRSVDGVHLAHDTPDANVTLVFARPTVGVFDLDGNKQIDEVDFLYLGFTRKGSAKRFDARLFYLFYRDARGVTKVDNRPLAVRQADREQIGISTLGGHYTRKVGDADVLAWGAWQTGDWGRLDHQAWVWDLEVGYQPPRARWKPWIRVGTCRTSGDANPGDRDHETFFQVLPTPRIYARFPFYNMMNTQDTFAILILRPTPSTTLRTEYHHLRLSEATDLWYSGGGAFQRASFGYAGRPSGGSRSLANVIDLSVDHRVSAATSLTIYVSHAVGGRAVSAIYPRDRQGNFAYLEVTRRF